MYCVIQEIELKKPNKSGYARELKSYFSEITINGVKFNSYGYRYSEERFERRIKKAYKISLHQSYRENGKLKKKQYPLCTTNYYDIAEGWFNVYDYCDKKINTVANDLGIEVSDIYDLVELKTDSLIKTVQNEFRLTEEYLTHEEHKRITTLHATNKAKFNEMYKCDKYDQLYDVFGNLMNKGKLDEVKADFKYRKEYEEKSRSYQEQFHGNYSKFFSGSGGSSYSNDIHSNHDKEDKETLKQFYRVLSKKFHPDANPDTDTSKQMQLLNQLKDQWGV